MDQMIFNEPTDPAKRIRMVPTIPDAEVVKQVQVVAEFLGCKPIDVLRISVQAYCGWVLRETASEQDFDPKCRTTRFWINIPKRLSTMLRERKKTASFRRKCQALIMREAGILGMDWSPDAETQ